MDELGIERAALVGNLFGGAVALRVALVAPERVSALVVVSAPAPLQDRVAAMQRRAFALRAEAGVATDAPDPVEQQPGGLAVLDVRPSWLWAGATNAIFLEAAELLAGTLPRARLAVIERAGHLAPLETPEAFREPVLRFLRERPSGRTGGVPTP
jgi:pimeloyl-ACP methyl ester carboxylesterase